VLPPVPGGPLAPAGSARWCTPAGHPAGGLQPACYGLGRCGAGLGNRLSTLWDGAVGGAIVVLVAAV